MTELRAGPFHLTIGIDPGQSGAIAALADGVPTGIEDMPVVARKAGGQMVDAPRLAAILRGLLQRHTGASALIALEQVGAMPGQGVSGMFRFGQGDGIIRGVVGALGIPMLCPTPQAWKKHHGLLKADKDAARGLAIERFPTVAHELARKKDVGRADALLIAAYLYAVEQKR